MPGMSMAAAKRARWRETLFLDGNSFRAGPRIAKKSLVADVNVGAALLFPHFRVSAGYTLRSKEFRGQKGDDEIGSLTVSFIP